jgi:hypothetical protein
MDIIRRSPRAESTVARVEWPQAKATTPVTRFPEHYPRRPPSLAGTLRQVFVQSLIAVLLVLVSAMLWAATFGGSSVFLEPPPQGVQHDVGLVPFAVGSV